MGQAPATSFEDLANQQPAEAPAAATEAPVAAEPVATEATEPVAAEAAPAAEEVK
jgi:hypothetical protein